MRSVRSKRQRDNFRERKEVMVGIERKKIGTELNSLEIENKRREELRVG